MFRAIRRRRALSEPDRSRNSRSASSHGRTGKKTVQWASDVKTGSGETRKPRSKSAIPYDQMLLKLSRATEVLERNQTLEEDFERVLNEIQEKLTEDDGYSNDEAKSKDFRSNTQ